MIDKTKSLLSEPEIIERIVGGELVLFEILIRRYNSALYKIARGYGYNHQDTEDLMQQAHVAAYRSLAKFEGRASYKTWISRIMVHLCHHKKEHGYFKNEKPDSDHFHENVLPMHTSSKKLESEVINRELANLLERSLLNIPESYRTVFILREIEHCSVAETAAILDLTEVNVKVRLNRAKAMLQKELEKFYSSAELFEFNLVYCNAIVQKVFEQIQS